MAPHSLGSGTISFGLVSIPVKLYTAASSGGVSFNLLHAKCGSRIKQQTFCPVCNEVVERSALVKGYEFQKDQYVRFTDEELKSLEGEASKVIDIAEFVPLSSVDPIYFEKTYYLGPDKGGEKPYRLLADAMAKSDKVALATFVMRGKESLVLVRPAQDGLMLHTMYFADEVRDFGEIEKGKSVKLREGELGLAERLIGELSHDEFKPEQYRGRSTASRVLDLANSKVEGKEITAVEPEAQRAQVIDLMDALKQSLAKRAAARAARGQGRRPGRQEAPREGAPARRRAGPKGPGRQEVARLRGPAACRKVCRAGDGRRQASGGAIASIHPLIQILPAWQLHCNVLTHRSSHSYFHPRGSKMMRTLIGWTVGAACATVIVSGVTALPVQGSQDVEARAEGRRDLAPEAPRGLQVG